MGGKNRHSNRGTSAAGRKAASVGSGGKSVKLANKQQNKKKPNPLSQADKKAKWEHRQLKQTPPQTKERSSNGSSSTATKPPLSKRQKHEKIRSGHLNDHVPVPAADEDAIAQVARALIEAEDRGEGLDQDNDDDENQHKNGKIGEGRLSSNHKIEIQDVEDEDDEDEGEVDEEEEDEEEEEEERAEASEEDEDDESIIPVSSAVLSRVESQPRRFRLRESTRLPLHDRSGAWNDPSALEKKRQAAEALALKHAALTQGTNQQTPSLKPQLQSSVEQRKAEKMDASKKRRREEVQEEEEAEGKEEEEMEQESDGGSDADFAAEEMNELLQGSEMEEKVEDDDQEEGEGNEDVDETEQQLSTEELLERRAARLFRLKAEIAEIAETVLEDPEKNIRKLSRLHELCQDQDIEVQRLALLSEVEVLRDLIPAYRIRLPTADETGNKQISKETAQIWNYEKALLAVYTRCVTFMLNLSKAAFKTQQQTRGTGYHRKHAKDTHSSSAPSSPLSPLAITVVRAITRLLESAYHFNLSKEMVLAVVPLSNHYSPIIRNLCTTCLTHIYTTDQIGDATLECVRQISHLVKKRGGRVHSEMLLTFLSLPLSREVIEPENDEEDGRKKKQSIKQQKKDKQKQQRKMRKKGKMVNVDEGELQKDLAEGEGVVNVERRRLTQTAILTSVFSTYFTILKQQHTSATLPAVLRGLAKFSHLINIELVFDLFDCLKRLIDPNVNGGGLSVQSTLYCVSTVFHLLSTGYGQSLEIDLAGIFNHFYATLFRFIHPREWQHLPLLLECTTQMFTGNSKQLNIERVAAFVRRLFLLTLYIPYHGSVAILHLIRLILSKHDRAKAMLDREVSSGGAAGIGSYLSEIDDADLANALNSTVWELSLLGRSSHPVLCVEADMIAEEKELSLEERKVNGVDWMKRLEWPRTRENDVEDNGNENELFYPPLPLPPGLMDRLRGTSVQSSSSRTKKPGLSRRLELKNASLISQVGQFMTAIEAEKRQQSRETSSLKEERQLDGELRRWSRFQWRERALFRWLRSSTILTAYNNKKPQWKLNGQTSTSTSKPTAAHLSSANRAAPSRKVQSLVRRNGTSSNTTT